MNPKSLWGSERCLAAMRRWVEIARAIATRPRFEVTTDVGVKSRAVPLPEGALVVDRPRRAPLRSAPCPVWTGCSPGTAYGR